MGLDDGVAFPRINCAFCVSMINQQVCVGIGSTALVRVVVSS